jgi:hypothetical protein
MQLRSPRFPMDRRRTPAAFDYLLLDYPPVYEHADALPLSFWAALRTLAAPWAVLVVNTDMAAPHGAEELAARLVSAGWRHTRIDELDVHDGLHSRVLVATPLVPLVPLVTQAALALVAALLVACACCWHTHCGRCGRWCTAKGCAPQARVSSVGSQLT